MAGFVAVRDMDRAMDVGTGGSGVSGGGMERPSDGGGAGAHWYQDEGTQYWLILLIVVIIYFLCAILFESLRQPLVIITLIPVSFIGTFLTFYFSGVEFGTGGFASLVLLSGIVVNAGIYIVNEYNNQRAARRGKPFRPDRLYVRAYNHKIIPVFLTTLSTVLGLVPFLIDGPEEEAFWFSFAIGTSGGLLFSILALVFVMPIFMPLCPASASGRHTVRVSRRTSP